MNSPDLPQFEPLSYHLKNAHFVDHYLSWRNNLGLVLVVVRQNPRLTRFRKGTVRLCISILPESEEPLCYIPRRTAEISL